MAKKKWMKKVEKAVDKAENIPAKEGAFKKPSTNGMKKKMYGK